MTMLFSPWFWLGVLLGAASLLGVGYNQGVKAGKNSCLTDQASVLEAAIKQAQAEAIEQAKAELQTTRKFETARETVRTVYVKVKEQADANIDKNTDYGRCGLDDDGLRLYNAKPAAPVPTPPATGLINLPLSGFTGSTGRPAGDPAAQQPGALSALLRMSGETQSALGMGQASTGKEGR